MLLSDSNVQGDSYCPARLAAPSFIRWLRRDLHDGLLWSKSPWGWRALQAAADFLQKNPRKSQQVLCNGVVSCFSEAGAPWEVCVVCSYGEAASSHLRHNKVRKGQQQNVCVWRSFVYCLVCQALLKVNASSNHRRGQFPDWPDTGIESMLYSWPLFDEAWKELIPVRSRRGCISKLKGPARGLAITIVMQLGC